jgi:hypothetical protein
MALQHLRSSTANKRPLPAVMADGQLAANTNTASPGLFFKDSAGELVKLGPVHVGTAAPNASPAAGGETGNTTGELWLDTSVTPNQLKTWNGSAWVSDFPDEIPVAKLADGTARQLLQTDAAGTGVEWTSNVDVPGTLDVTSTATFDSIAQHPLGSAAAPTLTFTGDTNTGIYSPGADQVAVATNGTQRLLIKDASQDTLRVSGVNAVVTADAISSNYPGFRLAVNGGILAGFDGASGDSASLTTYNAHPLLFGTSSAERLRITSAGLVGIGTSSPGAMLDIIPTGSTVPFRITSDDNGVIYKSSNAFTKRFQFFFQDNSGTQTARIGADISGANASNLQFVAGSGTTPQVTLNSSGQVGIGTTSPGESLSVNGNVSIGATSASGYRLFVNGSAYVAGSTNYIDGRTIFRTEGASEIARLESSGRLGIGTSSPQKLAHISNTYNAPTGGHNAETFLIVSNGLTNSNACGIEIQGGRSGASFIEFGDPDNADVGRIVYSHSANSLATIVNGSVATFIDSSGRVGIGTTAPNQLLQINSSSVDARIQITNSATGSTNSDGFHLQVNSSDVYFDNKESGNFIFQSGANEAARIDSSRRLLVGTSTNTNVASSVGALVQTRFAGSFTNFAAIRESGPSVIAVGRANGSAAQIVANNDILGEIRFAGADGVDLETQAAVIKAEVDGTPGANDMPGRLVFSTTADGASSPTERMRITSGGYVLAGKTASDLSVAGFQVAQTGQTDVTVNNSECMNINRNTSDGSLIRFFQDNTFEGSISVSGTTVSYNGAHLSRWSQLPSGAARTEILRGSVLSNLDEMCEWGEEDNEQLNRMKVSDVEGDKNVSGVFQAWDDDDDTYTNDFYCAMTGDFIIRIGAGVTVERGDLLMSAGDGTAKPQDDDIIRSKTIAKVTSTNVTCTYEDGSYCVPCVLMAC